MNYALHDYRLEVRHRQLSGRSESDRRIYSQPVRILGRRYLFLDLRVDQSQSPNPVCMLVMNDANEFPEVSVPFWECLDAWTSIAMGESDMAALRRAYDKGYEFMREPVTDVGKKQDFLATELPDWLVRKERLFKLKPTDWLRCFNPADKSDPDARFRKLYPNTPSVADLPSL